MNTFQAFQPSFLQSAVVLGVIILVLRTAWTAVYRLFFHPLAKYPGPTIAKLTSLYMVHASVQCRSTYHRHELHEKYGTVVRVGPNELSFCDIASIRDIYGQTSEPCPKAPFFYKGFTLTGTTFSIFATVDRNEHARMRRLLSNGLSERGVLQFQNDITIIIGQFINVLRSYPEQQSVNIYNLVHNLYLDITSELSFAQSFHILRDGAANQSARDIEAYFSVSPLYGIFPIARHLPFGIFRAAKAARPRLIKSVQSFIDNFRERLTLGATQSGLLRLMIEASDVERSESDEKNRNWFSDTELIENAVLFIVAGSGTSATTLLYLIYELGRRPQLQRRLEEEIRSAFPHSNVPPDYETVRQLPFLNGVLQETLRLRGPIPTAAPRVSPGKMIADRFVPSGTIVSNLAYTTQRDPTVFNLPNDFDPDRWLSNVTPGMMAMNRPFSTGSRNCIGSNLARVQLLLTVCALYTEFDIDLDQTRNTDAKMVMRDQGLMTPSGKQLWLNLRPRNT